MMKDRNTVIDMVLTLIKEIDYRSNRELKQLADIEIELEGMKDKS